MDNTLIIAIVAVAAIVVIAAAVVLAGKRKKSNAEDDGEIGAPQASPSSLSNAFAAPAAPSAPPPPPVAPAAAAAPAAPGAASQAYSQPAAGSMAAPDVGAAPFAAPPPPPSAGVGPTPVAPFGADMGADAGAPFAAPVAEPAPQAAFAPTPGADPVAQPTAFGQPAAPASPIPEPPQEVAPQTYNIDDLAPVSSPVVSVSTEDVDALATYQVYKQYKYYDQAAEELGKYLREVNPKPRELIWEYIGLYLESGNVDGFVTALNEVKDGFARAELEEIVRLGLQLDPENLRLRVFAEENLGWGVKDVNQEVGQDDATVLGGADGAEAQAAEGAADEGSQQDMETIAGSFGGTARSRQMFAKGKPLVQGYSRIQGIHGDEIGAISGLAPESKAAKLLANEVDYSYANMLYNRAIQSSNRPERIIIDAMMADAKNQNIDNYARHLWNLYHALGKSGRGVKSKMLNWGYSLGSHPLFQALETNPVDLQLKDLGVEYGYLADAASSVKAQMKALVCENADKKSKRVFDKVDEVVQEAETQLQYGQVEEAMDTLENAVMTHNAEPQLFTMLFDLYERSESWDRLQKFSVKIRNEIKNLPDEVSVALSHLTQRMNTGGIN